MLRTNYYFAVMKKIFFAILNVFCIASQAEAQEIKDAFSYWANYYPFNNGVQMVEVVFGVKDLRIYDYERRAMPWHVNDPDPTVYIFRNLNGKIINAYNLCGKKAEEFELLPPKVVNPSKLKTHMVSRYTIRENCFEKTASDNAWEIGGKYANADLSKVKCGAIDTMGNVIIQPKYEEVWVATKSNIMAAKLNGKYGILDENGKAIQPFIYDNLECQHYNGGAFILKKKEKFSYADSTGKIISKREYDFGELFWSRRARVAINGIFGFIDSSGTEVVPLIYKTAEAFYYNVAVVGDGKKVGMINNQGQIIEPVEYDRIVDIYDEKEMVTTGYIGYKNEQPTYFNRDGQRTKKPK